MSKKNQKVFLVDFVSTHVALHHTFTFPSERAFKRIDQHRTLSAAELQTQFEENRHDHLIMQLPAAMRPPTHGEKSAYYFSLEQALKGSCFIPSSWRKMFIPLMFGADWSAGVAMVINPVAVRTRLSCP